MTLASVIREKMREFESASLADLVFWTNGSDLSAIRECVETNPEFRFVAHPYMCEPEPWETRDADQHVHIFLEIAE